jgi:hypothetical protein
MMEAIAWLCRSPRRLAVAAVSVLTVLLVGGSALFGGGGGAGGGAAANGGSTSPKASATTETAQVPNANPYVAAALAFVRKWSQLGPGESTAQWQAALTPMTTVEFGQALRTTDTAKLPGVQPSGEPVVRFLAQTSALVAVSLADGSSVLVSLVSADSGGPLVSDLQPNAGN